MSRIDSPFLITAVAVVLFGRIATQCFADSTDSIRSLFAEVASVSEEMNVENEKDAGFSPDFFKVGEDLQKLKEHVKSYTPKAHEEALNVLLAKDVEYVDAAYQLWEYGRLHGGAVQADMLFPTATIQPGDPLYESLDRKYGSTELSSDFKSGVPVETKSLMISFIVSARYDSEHIESKISAVEAQGSGSLTLRYPLTLADAKAAIKVGTQLDAPALYGDDVEWHVEADVNNEDGEMPSATIETPFFQVAVLTAQRKAKYEAIPRPPDVTARNIATLIADIRIYSRNLHSFDESACILKQGASVLHATSKDIGSPQAIESYFGYTVTCSFSMKAFNAHKPYIVTLANVPVFDTSQQALKTG